MEKTNAGLVEYAKAQLGNPYWYGTYGQTASESLYQGKKKQYPQYYTATDFAKQYGKRVHDCSGLIKGYLMSDSPTSNPKYNKAYDYSANGTRNACKEKGDISSMPDLPGVLVFYDGHVGIYIGNGEVIEARGHAYGVVRTKLSSRGWKWWGKHPAITYTEEKKEEKAEETASVTLPVLVEGSKVDAVRTVQRLCNALGFKGKTGYTLTVDGDYGSYTSFAVKSFQKAKGLTADGIVGKKTWEAFFKA